MSKLRLEWTGYAMLSAGFIAGGYWLLRSNWSAEHAVTWLPLPILAVVYLFSIAWRNLKANHRNGESELLSTFGWGNRLTLLRGVLIAGMLGFLMLPEPPGLLVWIPAVLYTLADAADFFDGYVARVTNHTTRLGEILDMSFDGLGVLIAALLAVQYGKVPVWYVLIGLARYLYLAGLWVRRRMGRPNYELPPSLSRRVFAGLQMGFLAAVLWPVFTPPGTYIAAGLFGLPLLIGFGRDWLYVSGVLHPGIGITDRTGGLIQRWLPVGLRVLILGLSLTTISNWVLKSSQLTPALNVLGLLNLATVLMLIAGFLPRVAAIGGLIVLGFYQLFSPLTPTQILLAVAYTIILYIGSGALSAWTPEDYLYRHHAGKRRVLKARAG